MLSEDEVLLDLQSPPGTMPSGVGQLELLEPSLCLPVAIVGQRGQAIQLSIRADESFDRAALLRLIYSSRHWFHAPRRLSSADALLAWLHALWRPDPLLRRRS